MKQLFCILILLALTACKKDKTPEQESTPVPTKWELIPGHYKVYDTLGNFIYEMDISHTIGSTIEGYRVDSLTFGNFDGNFNFTAAQNQCTTFPNCIRIGSLTAANDSSENRWDIFGYNVTEEYNNFRNDTIVFYFEKQNMPYWWNDGTTFFQGNLKHVAVKQH